MHPNQFLNNPEYNYDYYNSNDNTAYDYYDVNSQNTEVTHENTDDESQTNPIFVTLRELLLGMSSRAFTEFITDNETVSTFLFLKLCVVLHIYDCTLILEKVQYYYVHVIHQIFSVFGHFNCSRHHRRRWFSFPMGIKLNR